MSAISQFVNSFEPAPKQPRLRVKAKPTEPAPKRAKRVHLTSVEVAVDDASRRALSGEWEGAKGATFVGLYAMCHRMVYGVTPSELQLQSVFNVAAKTARKAMHELFNDDAAEFAAFIRWAWEAEKRKAAWAQQKAFDRRRLSWRYQFSRSLETDYRIDLKSKGRRR
jgi:hypothetical protein